MDGLLFNWFCTFSHWELESIFSSPRSTCFSKEWLLTFFMDLPSFLPAAGLFFSQVVFVVSFNFRCHFICQPPPSMFFRTLELCQSVYPDTTSLDLLFARPNQTLQDWKSELSQILRYCSNHVSVYELTVEPSTPLAIQVENGELVGWWCLSSCSWFSWKGKAGAFRSAVLWYTWAAEAHLSRLSKKWLNTQCLYWFAFTMHGSQGLDLGLECQCTITCTAATANASQPGDWHILQYVQDSTLELAWWNTTRSNIEVLLLLLQPAAADCSNSCSSVTSVSFFTASVLISYLPLL